MLSVLRRTVTTLFSRALDAAGTGKRWSGQPRVINLNSDLLAAATISAQRASYFCRNHPVIARSVASLVANAVGTGIKPRSAHPDPKVRDALHRLWERWVAFAHRATQHLPAAHRVALPEAARAYAGRPLLSLAAELADRRGAPVGRYLNPHELYQRAMTTSNFQNLLANTANKVLLPAYQAAAPSYRRFFARRDLRDFKKVSLVRIGDFPVPLKVGENAEYKNGAISDSGESAQLAHYGRIITLSREAIVNDDLNGFADLPAKAALRVADWENSFAWAMIVANPTMADGAALFHASHGNLAGAGRAISVISVGAGEAAMMKQTSLDGLKLNLTPAVLATSPDEYTLARQFTTKTNPVHMDQVNPFAKTLAPIGDANLSGNGWYLFAEPTALESFAFGYFQGSTGPQITPEPGFEVAGLRLRLTIDFYTAFSDYRGAYYNAGA